jgi:hypothetical protein
MVVDHSLGFPWCDQSAVFVPFGELDVGILIKESLPKGVPEDIVLSELFHRFVEALG